MSKKTAIFLAIACLTAGIVIGGWSAIAFTSRFTNKHMVTSFTAEAGTAVGTLYRLRGGKTNEATELLEIKLDGAVIGMGAFLADSEELKRDPMHIRTLQMAKDYRTKFPRNSEHNEIEQGVAAAFALLDEQSGR